ncbi:hypothetical protein [Streptomyces glaucescens]|uniref:Translation initiation factor IF-2 n=1 Tax=Streptomyces glaucescens TaxID=1907 RepID=A0A089XGH2_STRGA|nr:hypothetical protein [Streptomyces glaucescens]AIS00275.1 translation initiation factor IF-2 [Streptomyces glaucescens]
MAGEGSGGSRGGTSFEGMSHEQMLAWLDQADSGTVQAAARKLVAAAEQIREIAEELKIRPQWVEWKGEGADAFRTWAGDLANSALRLADFSGDSGTWLSLASGAIATAQAAVPRDESGTSAGPTAARAHLTARSGAELAALKARKEKVRQEAAAEMRKLAQAYALSSSQMDSLPRPEFPPPPAAISIGTPEDLARPSSGRARGEDAGDAASPVARPAGEAAGQATAGRPDEAGSFTGAPADPHRPATTGRPVHVEIDSAGTLPERHIPVTAPGPTAPTRPDPSVLPAATGMIPPTSDRGGGRRPTVSGGGGRPTTGGRVPFAPRQEGTGLPRGRDIAAGGPFPHRSISGTAAGRTLAGPGAGPGRDVPAASGAPAGRPTDSGVMGGRPTGPAVTGGRPTGPGAVGARPASPGVMGGHPVNQAVAGGRPSVTPAAGTPSGRLPGGTVVGGDPAAHRGPTGPALAVRAPSTPRSGVVGGTPQRAGRAPARPGAPVPSAPTRGGITGGTPSDEGDRAGGRRPLSPTRSRQGGRQQTGRRDGASATD